MSQTEEILENEDLLLEDDNTLDDRYLTFKLGSEDYAIEIKFVTEIIGVQKVTEIPNVKKYIKGIINLRGIIYPVVDVRKRFQMNEIEWNDRTCIIIVTVDNSGIGLIVDEVAEVMYILPKHISPPPQTNKGSQSRFIQAIGKISDQVKIILDIHKLLFDVKKVEKEVE